jgi:diguanylate cyclase (GGDEF)-like protein
MENLGSGTLDRPLYGRVVSIMHGVFTAMSTTELPLPNVSAGNRTQEIRRSLRRLERRDWSLWWSAVLVMLSLTAAVVSLSLSVSTRPDEPFFQFHIGQSVRGLVGLVLLFNVYTIYQQVRLKQLRFHLAEQIEIATEQHTRAEEFLKLAMLDPLTGLHNRRFAQERLTAEIARSQRHGHSLTVLMFDLDGFKPLNDRYGHSAGDLVLKRFAERLTKAIRGSDLGVRLGGDEFLVLLPECQLGQVQHVLDRLHTLEIDFSGEKISFAFSAGWADHQPGESLEQFLQRADQALYANKQIRKSHLHPVT